MSVDKWLNPRKNPAPVISLFYSGMEAAADKSGDVEGDAR